MPKTDSKPQAAQPARAQSPPAQPLPSRFLPVLLVLFAGSGCSALIYEIVWYQLLQLVIGSTAISLAVLLATFMGGLCLGSMALPRILAAQKEHPLRAGDRPLRGPGAFRDAASGWRLHRRRGTRNARDPSARGDLRGVFVTAHVSHGRILAGRRAVA
jgi:hypothetical protein